MDNHLKISDRNISGYWNVTYESKVKWKAMIPGGKGKMIAKKMVEVVLILLKKQHMF